MIHRFGGIFEGFDNLKNPGSLDWVLDAIQYPIFDIDRFPTIFQKAAQLGWIINEGHVFHDGNKRTSTMAVMIFMNVNNYAIEATENEFIEISERVATCKISGFTFDGYVSWIEERSRQVF